MFTLCVVGTCPPSLIGFFALVLVVCIIVQLPLLLISKNTKFKLISVKAFLRNILVLLVLAIIESTIYQVSFYLTTHAEKVENPRVITDIKVLSTGLKLFKLDNYAYPTSDEGLELLVSNSNPSKYQNWKQRLPIIPLDPWKNPYQYLSPGTHGEFDLYSLGSDGVQSNDDLGSWEIESRKN